MKRTLTIVLALISLQYTIAQDIQSGLLLHYNLANNAEDLSSNLNNGVIQGSPNATTDRFGVSNGAMDFDYEYIIMPVLPVNKSVSFSVWLKSNETHNGFVIENYNYRVNKGLALSFDGEYDLRFAGRLGTNQYYSIEDPNFNTFDNNWHHVVAVFDNNNWKLYIDNTLLASANQGPASPTINSGEPFILGNYLLDGANKNRYFKGSLDDLRIYDRALTEEDVNTLFSLESDGNGGDVLSNGGGSGESLWSANGDDVFYKDGNVGIGTSQPDQMLTVNGKIHTKEVIVDLSVPAPDYVFKSDYELRSLDDLRTYLKQYSHLPEVPSANEMEANGVEVGEMNMLLLKKIEELTLYQLQQDEEITALKNMVKLLVKENEKHQRCEK